MIIKVPVNSSKILYEEALHVFERFDKEYVRWKQKLGKM